MRSSAGCKALQQKHLPFDVLPVGELATMATKGALDRYRLVVLPDVGVLGAETARALDEFVEHGGNLLVTGNSAVTPEGAAELVAGPALRRIGDELSGNAVWSTYATLDEQPHADRFRYEGSVVPIHGTRARHVWRPDTVKRGSIVAQAPWGPPELSYGHTLSGDPAVASVRYGSGVCAVIPWTVGRTYREFAKTEVRDHLLLVLEPLAGVRVSAALPEQVELIVGRDEDGLVVHILNQTGARRRSFGPHVPVADGRLVLRDATGDEQATALVAGRGLATHRDGDALVVELPVIDLFEIVRIS